MSQESGQAKKFNDPLNNKIQKKFDQVFQLNDSTSSIQTSELDLLEESMNFNSPSGETKMNQKKSKSEEEPNIDFDFSDDDGGEASASKDKSSDLTKPTAVMPNSKGDDLGFSIDFNFDDDNADAAIETKAVATTEANASTGGLDLGEDEGFTIEGLDHATSEEEVEDDDRTRVTEAAFSLKDLKSESSAIADNQDAVEEMNFVLDDSGDEENAFNAEEIEIGAASADLTPSVESKKSIESTIRDIVKPKLESTNEFQLDSIDLDLGSDDNATKEVKIDKLASSPSDLAKDSVAETFESDEDMFLDPLSSEKVSTELPPMPPAISVQPSKIAGHQNESVKITQETPMSSLSSEDSIRFQSTIRALREEREDLLNQIKSLKSEVKEVNQDNLTLKANLDEAKIEITILRKRHLVEVEDIKYRLSMSEEKKLMAEEKARQADLKREKLEQKVRIDFNQVKQREKELESKLELLSMDVDSQVHSRDQKILELRRKIDALEFNMENASIKEQKSLEDKRKLEDRLNKIMKTLRHSIKNLEDDITDVDQEDHGKDKN